MFNLLFPRSGLTLQTLFKQQKKLESGHAAHGSAVVVVAGGAVVVVGVAGVVVAGLGVVGLGVVVVDVVVVVTGGMGAMQKPGLKERSGLSLLHHLAKKGRDNYTDGKEIISGCSSTSWIACW